MKIKVTLILLVLCLLCACSGKTQTEPMQDYQAMAQALVEAGEYEAAVAVLEEGLRQTGDTALEDSLKLIQAMITADTTPQPETTGVPETTTAPETTTEPVTTEPMLTGRLLDDLDWTYDPDSSDYQTVVSVILDGQVYYDGQAYGSLSARTYPFGGGAKITRYGACIQGTAERIDFYLRYEYTQYSENGANDYILVFYCYSNVELLEGYCNGEQMSDGEIANWFNTWAQCGG